jgi:hypothetical protein
MTDPVRQDQVPAGRVQELAGPEENAGEILRQELRPGAAGAVQDEGRVGDPAGRVTPRSPDRPVVDSQLRENVAGPESEVAENEIARDGFGDR